MEPKHFLAAVAVLAGLAVFMAFGGYVDMGTL